MQVFKHITLFSHLFTASKNLTSALTEIKLMERGFSVNEPFGAKPKLYNWTEIKNVQFSESYDVIIIETSTSSIRLQNNNIGWYEFIQNVPIKYSEFDVDYAKSFINSLNPCGVCGLIAVNDGKCIVCKTNAWNDAMVNTEVEYLKSNQSEFYSELIKKGQEVKKIAEPEHGFKADKNWKLYI